MVNMSNTSHQMSIRGNANKRSLTELRQLYFNLARCLTKAILLSPNAKLHLSHQQVSRTKHLEVPHCALEEQCVVCFTLRNIVRDWFRGPQRLANSLFSARLTKILIVRSSSPLTERMHKYCSSFLALKFSADTMETHPIRCTQCTRNFSILTYVP